VPLAAVTPNTITDPERLQADLEETRRCGYAISMEETDQGAGGVAAPVRTTDGYAIAAIGVAGPLHRLSDARLGQIGGIPVQAPRPCGEPAKCRWAVGTGIRSCLETSLAPHSGRSRRNSSRTSNDFTNVFNPWSEADGDATGKFAAGFGESVTTMKCLGSVSLAVFLITYVWSA
jgi:hypothetical protein